MKSFTGGLASRLLDATRSGLTKHSGLIGKVAKSLGENARGKIVNISDKVLKYVPEGNVKIALTSINKSAKCEAIEEPLEKSANTPKPERPLADTGGGSTNNARTYI